MHLNRGWVCKQWIISNVWDLKQTDKAEVLSVPGPLFVSLWISWSLWEQSKLMTILGLVFHSFSPCGSVQSRGVDLAYLSREPCMYHGFFRHHETSSSWEASAPPPPVSEHSGCFVFLSVEVEEAWKLDRALGLRHESRVPYVACKFPYILATASVLTLAIAIIFWF